MPLIVSIYKSLSLHHRSQSAKFHKSACFCISVTFLSFSILLRPRTMVAGADRRNTSSMNAEHPCRFLWIFIRASVCGIDRSVRKFTKLLLCEFKLLLWHFRIPTASSDGRRSRSVNNILDDCRTSMQLFVNLYKGIGLWHRSLSAKFHKSACFCISVTFVLFSVLLRWSPVPIGETHLG